MRTYETTVQELKDHVLTRVAELAWEDKLTTGILDIPEKIIPGPEARMRCCIYKERAIVNQRVKLALGGYKANPAMVEVLQIACDECPVTQIEVGASCRGCIATRCMHACPKGAISIVNHRATIDQSKCVMCGKCMEACPYKAIEKSQRPCEQACVPRAIAMGEDRKAAIDVNKCTACGACVYQCPFGAIMDKSYIVDAVQMLRGAAQWNYHVYAVVAPAIAGQFEPAKLGQVVTGLKMLGFYDVAETALGADLTAHAESEELLEKGKLLSSCCPAFVNYVEKFFPDLAQYISHTPSPMVMIGRKIREKDPKARVIFIGPCVAKKQEAQMGKTMGAIDLSITFEELSALFASRGIDDLTALEETHLDHASGYGRSFAHSGGVAAAVAQGIKERGAEDFKLTSVACSGLAQCRMELMKFAKGIGGVNFLEGMACEGGCVQGPAVIVRSPKNDNFVKQHAKAAGDRTITEAVAGADK